MKPSSIFWWSIMYGHLMSMKRMESVMKIFRLNIATIVVLHITLP